MELRDLIVTPLLLIVIYVVALIVRPRFTNPDTRVYFIPALTLKIFGALAVGFIYQFYYNGGDTFVYHTHGSRPIWEAIMESPFEGFRILFSSGEYGPGLWEISERVWYWKDANSFFVIQVAVIFDLITFSSYSGTAVLFAVVAFIGGWLLFTCFYKQHADMHRSIAIATLFVPTVVFWGSGIFKDSLTLAALGAATYAFHSVFILKEVQLSRVTLLVFAMWVIYSIKVYILLCFLPSAFLWWFMHYLNRVDSVSMRLMLAPFVVAIALGLGYLALASVAADNPRYNVNRLAETARITAYDIRYGWGARLGEGSGYTLGELDGNWTSMLRLAPSAINVSLFRPYLWEVRNSLMLLSAVEAFICLMLTLYVIVRGRTSILQYALRPDVMFCLVFSLMFAFAVGVSTYNFGTLSRYKIPVMPFYLLALFLIFNYWKRERKVEAFDSTE